MTITIRESGIPRLRRTFWIEGDGSRLLGLRGFGQATTYAFDVWQLQNRMTHFDVPLTGQWNIEALIALGEVAAAWDETFTVPEPEGAERITVHPGTKAGMSKATTLAAWAQFAEVVASGVKRPQPEPPPVLTPLAPRPAVPPAQLLIPADAEPISAADAGIALKTTGFYAKSLARPGGSYMIKWTEVKPAWDAWVKARGVTVKLFPDPEEPHDEPDTRRLVSPHGAYDRLYAEAARRPEALKAARTEAGVDIGEPGAPPPPVVVRKRPIWPALLVGGIVVGGIWSLWKGRRG